MPYIEAEKLRTGDTARSNGKIVMATVKGDVHDIGKNIVGVVLRCNNFEVIDLGVMVPAQKILDIAKAENADMIGLSGLITPSLEEMSHVAKEMQRQEFHVPLLIGGATTSRAHTALKIEPHYKSPTVWVKDASRAVGVAQSLISKELVDDFLARVRAEYAEIRERHKDKSGAKKLVTLDKARAQRFDGDWASYVPPKPNNPGITVFDDYPIAELIAFIDWTPFFNAWELSGRFPAILDDAVVGKQATELYRDAHAMLDSIVAEKWLTARGVIGFWPAHAEGDDVVLSDGRATKLHFLRQQADKPADRPDFCLADFVAPKSAGAADWIGAFAVTAGIGIEAHLERFERDHDDYSSILLKALADRLAEAFAERLHERVRREFWGYAPDEALDNECADRRAVPRHPSGAGLSRVPGPHREVDAVRTARCDEECRHRAHGKLRDVSDRRRVRMVFLAPAKPVLRRRTPDEGTGRGLRQAQGLDARPSRALARAESRLRSRMTNGMAQCHPVRKT